MRVLHVTAGKLYGGIETYLVTLARHRHLAGMAPSYAVCYEGRLSEELRAEGVVVDSVGAVRFSRPWSVWRARRRFADLLRRDRPAVVVCHECWPHALFAPVVRRAGLPLVFAAHDIHAGRHWVERWAAWTPPDLALANSAVTRDSLGTLFPTARTELVHLPVPGPESAPAREGRDTVVILIACRLEEWKGHAVLLEALARLGDVPGWECWIAGGPQRPEDEAYLNRLRQLATGRVKFLGQRRDVAALMAAADIHCQPNTAPEPFGIAFVEALYAGLPVVSTAIGGAKEIVDETCGVLVPPGDAAALADALKGLIADPGRRAALGREGPARAARLCDPAAQMVQLAQTLSGVGGRS